MRRWLTGLALVTAGTVLAAGCSAGQGAAGPTTSGSDGAAPTTSLAIGFILEPTSLDFTQADGAAIPQVLLDNVYETLVRLDDRGELSPGLATAWQVSDDGLTYTFTLRPDVTFSDGAPFTAQDAAFSIDRVTTDWKPSVKAGMAVVASATATDDTTLTVTLQRPSNSWLYAMTGRIGAMFSRTGVADLATTPIGTGPYTVARWTRGDSIELQRNPTYSGTAPALETVTFRYFQDPTAMNNALLTGGIQVISTVPTPETLGQFSDQERFRTVEGSTNGEVMMSLNNGRAPLDDVRVRQAINYALDKQAILDGAWDGYGTVIGSHEAPTDPWFTDLADVYPHDVAKARQLLAEAGRSDLRLSLTLPPVPYAQAAAPIIVSQLAEAGITVDVGLVTFDVWLDQVFGNADYDMTIINHVEPRDLATIWGNPQYYTRFDDPQVQQLLAAADAGTPEQFVADNREVVELLAQDAAAAWLWSFPNLMVADADVQGLPENALGESFDVAGLSVE